MTVDDVHPVVARPLVIGQLVVSQFVEDDGAGVVAAVRTEEFKVIQELFDLLFFPGVAALVVGDAKDAFAKDVLKRMGVIHRGDSLGGGG